MKTPKSRAARARAGAILSALEQQVPSADCELVHADAWQLLVATILSAQSTDRGVNKVTPVLFARYPTPAALATAPQEDVEKIVHSTGFFRQKAKNIREAARLVVERHGGEVPREMTSLTRLPGVARKTANVVLGTAFGIAEGVTVDVHATRVSQRLGLSSHLEPAKIEADLMALFVRGEWIDLGHRLVLHGRYTCLARNPRCELCLLAPLCPSRAVLEPTRAPKLSNRDTARPRNQATRRSSTHARPPECRRTGR